MKPNRFLITIIILLILGFIFSPRLGPLKNIVNEVTDPFASFFSHSTLSISNFFQTIRAIGDLAKENNELKKKNLELESKLADLKEVGHENEILKRELGFFQGQEEYQLIPSQVIARSPSGFLETLKIDKGKDDGVQLDRPVLSQGFMIGKISQVYSDSAEVFLITNSNSLVPVVLQDSRGTGLLRGGLAGLTIEDVALDTEIKIGEKVLTSGLGGELLAGLPIGAVEKVISIRSEIFQKTTVKSPVEFGKLEIVFVMR